MEEDVRQRVRQILFYKNESVNSFCLKTTDNKKDYQAKQKRYNSQINGTASLSVSTISDILCTFNDISVCWLINGVGEMTNTYGSSPSIVSKMLGHTKIATTEQYAKILNKNVKDQFLLLKEKIKRGK